MSILHYDLSYMIYKNWIDSVTKAYADKGFKRRIRPMVNYSNNLTDKGKMYARQRKLMESMSDSLDMRYNVQSSINTNDNNKTGN